jgi:hypothetical protein
VSGIASFITLPIAAVAGLREAAVPKKRLFGPIRDNYHEYLREHGSVSAEYKWSGFVITTILLYLKEKQHADLMHSEYDELSTFLTRARSSTHFILTVAQRTTFDGALNVNASDAALRDYYNEMNGTDETEIGQPMADGLRAIRDCLRSLDERSIAILQIG